MSRECAVELIAAMSRRTVRGRHARCRRELTGHRAQDHQSGHAGFEQDDGRRARAARTARRGDAVRWRGAVRGAAYALTYDAETEVELLEIDREVVQGQLARSPELANLLEAFPIVRTKKATPKKPAVALEEEPPDDEDREAPPVETFRKGVTRLLKPLQPRSCASTTRWTVAPHAWRWWPSRSVASSAWRVSVQGSRDARRRLDVVAGSRRA